MTNIGIIETPFQSLSPMLSEILQMEGYDTRIFINPETLDPDQFASIDLVVIPLPDPEEMDLHPLVNDISVRGVKVIILSVWAITKTSSFSGQGIELIPIPCPLEFILERVKALLSQ